MQWHPKHQRVQKNLTLKQSFNGLSPALTSCCLLHVTRRDMQHFGIKVSIIEPGFFKTNVTRTDLIDADLRRRWARLPQDVKDSYGAAYFDECE